MLVIGAYSVPTSLSACDNTVLRERLFYNRLHYGILKLGPHFANRGLDHHDGDNFFLGVDPEVCAVCAAPTEAAI